MRSKTGRARRSLLLVPLAAILAAAMAFAGTAFAHHHHGGDLGGPAGKIASYDKESGQLVIDLAQGGQTSGLVTKYTWIETAEACPGPPTARRRHFCPAGRRRDGNGWGWPHGNGSTSDLVPGATIEDALLFLKDGRAFYAKVDLAGGGEGEGAPSSRR
ncbi:MAG TPA: hypothetical protein VF731_07810 [Solirubrobacterales bacterium]